jgi:hypothetical protein
MKKRQVNVKESKTLKSTLLQDMYNGVYVEIQERCQIKSLPHSNWFYFIKTANNQFKTNQPINVSMI